MTVSKFVSTYPEHMSVNVDLAINWAEIICPALISMNVLCQVRVLTNQSVLTPPVHTIVIAPSAMNCRKRSNALIKMSVMKKRPNIVHMNASMHRDRLNALARTEWNWATIKPRVSTSMNALWMLAPVRISVTMLRAVSVVVVQSDTNWLTIKWHAKTLTNVPLAMVDAIKSVWISRAARIANARLKVSYWPMIRRVASALIRVAWKTVAAHMSVNHWMEKLNAFATKDLN